MSGDPIANALAALKVYVDFHQPGIADRGADTRLLEAIAWSAASIADSLATLAGRP